MKPITLRYFAPILVATLLFGGSRLWAHHASFYRTLFAAVNGRDLGDVRKLFSKAGWNGESGGIPHNDPAACKEFADILDKSVKSE